MDVVAKEFVTEFQNIFHFLKGKKIVLYGLGYRTESVIENLTPGGGGEFNFIGLMDREKENIGKIFWGLPVMSSDEVIAKADAIIIISVSFYDVIYKRIHNIQDEYNIPIYFPNGKKASFNHEEFTPIDKDYSALNDEYIKEKINSYDVISFDLFDTLIMRKTLDPDMVFEIMGLMLQDKRFYKLRKDANVVLRPMGVPTFDSIYDYIKINGNYSEQYIKRLQALEYEIEKKVLIIRKDILNLFNYAKDKGKKVYILSDMYLSLDMIYEIVSNLGIDIDKKNIILSSEYQKAKEDGTLYDVLKEREICKKILHIGDDIYNDVNAARRSDIDALRIYSSKELMRHTGLNKFLTGDLSLFSRISLGLLAQKLFNSPFAYKKIDEAGKILVDTEEDLGYFAYGALITAYLSYILQECKRNGINKLLFLAREGFLLQKDFDIYNALLNNSEVESRYLKISRLLIMKTLLETKEDVEDFAKLPYRGNIIDYFNHRFNIVEIDADSSKNIEIPNNYDEVKPILNLLNEQILSNSRILKNRYAKYLRFDIGNFNNSALVDFGYTGSTQYYLSKFLQKSLTGFYLLADMSNVNNYNVGQIKYSYIYDSDDPCGTQSIVKKMFLLLEAVFTAPYGTFSGINNDGEFYNTEKTMNNKLFAVKEKINDGIISFLLDIVSLTENEALKLDFNDEIGSELLAFAFGEQVVIKKETLDTFYQDDILRYHTDRKIFD